MLGIIQQSKPKYAKDVLKENIPKAEPRRVQTVPLDLTHPLSIRPVVRHVVLENLLIKQTRTPVPTVKKVLTRTKQIQKAVNHVQLAKF
jgi:hypothetical protein